ncbi:MAG: 2-isopropylmalate synthase [Acidobacteria bacterium]|nr:2-isopropylmalate synthase [Acidobacteriota bacterium]
MSERVYIFDTTLRDGEQSPGCSMTTPEKLTMARKLVDMGVDLLEAGFPIASAGDYEAVREVSREFPEARVAALARTVPKDIERALDALDKAKNPRLHCFIATSEIHLKYKLNKTEDEVLEAAVKGIEQARKHVDDVEFSAEDGTRTNLDYLRRISKAAVDAGATTINIPDTVGFMVPEEYAQMIAAIVAEVGDRAIVSVHTHDDLGLAVANAMAAVSAGARQIECTINGIGERAGNCSLEECAVIMKVRADHVPFHTNIKTELLYPASQLLASMITFGPQPNKAIVGANAFAHEAGIHQDGYLKNPLCYEIMPPELVGVPASNLVLGKHSGRHALNDRVKDLGYEELSRDQLNRLYDAFTTLADNRKGLTNSDIISLLNQLQIQERGARQEVEALAPGA